MRNVLIFGIFILVLNQNQLLTTNVCCHAVRPCHVISVLSSPAGWGSMKRKRRHVEPSAWSTSCLLSTFSFGWVCILSCLRYLHLYLMVPALNLQSFPRMHPYLKAIMTSASHYLWNQGVFLCVFGVNILLLICYHLVLELLGSGDTAKRN